MAERDPSLDFGFVLPKVSVGDYVWVDTNRDGIQYPRAEKGIKDVVLTITGPDGKPSTMCSATVESITTDENGEYTFVNLPVLKAGESYTVRLTRRSLPKAVGAVHSDLDTGADRGTDSSTWTHLRGSDQGRRPGSALDFGFVLPKVSVGDYVWVDTNRDGMQVRGEKGIKDVVLTITGPDGKPVTDVFGKPVGPRDDG